MSERRPSARQRGYTRRWELARRAYLAEHPLCEECRRRGIVTAATVVDHVTPHRGDMDLFWDEANWQGLCATDHDAKTAREDGGFGNAPGRAAVGGCGVDGMPSDERHPWRQMS